MPRPECPKWQDASLPKSCATSSLAHFFWPIFFLISRAHISLTQARSKCFSERLSTLPFCTHLAAPMCAVFYC